MIVFQLRKLFLNKLKLCIVMLMYWTLYCYLYLQSVVMLMFREEKSPEDEIKAWQFWHGRQHSVKQRILDAGKIFFLSSILVDMIHITTVIRFHLCICYLLF